MNDCSCIFGLIYSKGAVFDLFTLSVVFSHPLSLILGFLQKFQSHFISLIVCGLILIVFWILYSHLFVLFIIFVLLLRFGLGLRLWLFLFLLFLLVIIFIFELFLDLFSPSEPFIHQLYPFGNLVDLFVVNFGFKVLFDNLSVLNSLFIKGFSSTI